MEFYISANNKHHAKIIADKRLHHVNKYRIRSIPYEISHMIMLIHTPNTYKVVCK
jgi:hypothetical protein